MTKTRKGINTTLLKEHIEGNLTCMENQPPEGISRDKNNVIYVSGISLPFYVTFIEIFSLTLRKVRYD